MGVYGLSCKRLNINLIIIYGTSVTYLICIIAYFSLMFRLIFKQIYCNIIIIFDFMIALKLNYLRLLWLYQIEILYCVRVWVRDYFRVEKLIEWNSSRNLIAEILRQLFYLECLNFGLWINVEILIIKLILLLNF